MKVNEKVDELRNQMKKKGLAAWIINGTDPHNSEYVNARWRSREFISGFTGSAGIVVITMDKALIWVDSRYFVQCASQIKKTYFEMKKIDGPEASNPYQWLCENLKKNAKVGIASETLMVADERKLSDMGVKICPCEDILNKVWKDRPDMPSFPVVEMEEELCGESVKSKIERIRAKAKEDKASYVLVSSLDDIAWILNLRGSDIQDTPVFMSHLLIGPKDVKLFTPVERFKDVNLKDKNYKVLPYENVIEELSLVKGSICLNPKKINMQLFSAIGSDVKIVEKEEYSTLFKACKNEEELSGMRAAHILDGVALVNFLAEVASKKNDYTEVSIALALEEERAMEESYLGPSFDTIAGFAHHGAVVHYSATKKTDIPITGNGLLVLDSGAQYTFGTTDITRTLLFGKATKEQKQDYTLVLKGHLALASQIFPKGTDGHQLDVLAHQFLWNNGMTYFHGTGHGVGHRLSVHEGPQRISISPLCAGITLEKGMVISDEPGVYKEGKHGVRIENLVAVTEAFENEFGTFYTFETLTCCPYERKLIDTSLLTDEEINLVDGYHAWVYSKLKDMVEPKALKYLKEATKPLLG